MTGFTRDGSGHKMSFTSSIKGAMHLAGVFATAAAILPAQLLVAGPVFRDRETLPRLGAHLLCRLFNLDVTLKGQVSDRAQPMIYCANHTSHLDPVVLKSVLRGAFISKAEVAKWPLVGTMADAMGAIFVQRNKGGQFLNIVQEQVAHALNKGKNIIVFPEGTTTDGPEVLPFKAGVLTIMFNNVSNVPLEKEAAVQPLAIKIKSVGGVPVDSDPESRFAFVTGQRKLTAGFWWNRLKGPKVDLEVVALPVMDRRADEDREQFTERTRQVIRSALFTNP